MISIIVPTYNEAANIVPLITAIDKKLNERSYEIIVVDDNSPDGTWRLVQNLSKKNHRIRLVRRIGKRGLTSALNVGINLSKGNIIAWLDADLSHPPALIAKMAGLLPTADAVVASRYVAGGRDKRQEKLAVILSSIINKVCQILLYRDFSDYTSGYILVKKSYLKNYKLRGDYGEYFINLMFYLKKNDAKIKEVGYVNLSRTQGISKTAVNPLGFAKRGLKYVSTLFSLCLKK